MNNIIGIGEYAVSNNEADTIKTFALASCIAITAYIPAKKVAGMLHIALPSPASEEEGRLRPYYYASTGIPLFIDKICKQYNSSKDELNIHIYGGANSINKRDVFNIGKRNIETVTKILYGLKLKLEKVEVGGSVSRTIELDLASGMVIIHTQPIGI